MVDLLENYSYHYTTFLQSIINLAAENNITGRQKFFPDRIAVTVGSTRKKNNSWQSNA